MAEAGPERRHGRRAGRRGGLALALACVVGLACDGGGDAPPEEPASCAPAPVPAGQVRARALLDCADDLPVGVLAAGRPGDLVLENAVARFVVRAGGEGVALVGLPGGHVVDAVRLGPDGRQDGEDPLREYALTADFHLLWPEAVTVVADGAGGEAIVRVTGAVEPFETILAVLPFARPDVRMTHEYVLRPDRPLLELRTRLESDGPVSTTPIDLMFWGGDARLFVPGAGAWEVATGASGRRLGLVSVRARDDVPAAATASAQPRQVLSFGPVKGFVYDSADVGPAAVEIVRWLAVGGEGASRDLAGALAVAGAALGDTPVAVSGTVAGAAGAPGALVVEARDAAGGPLATCRPDAAGAFACLLPADTAAVAAAWAGDGNGGLGGPGQGGDPRPLGPPGEALELPAPAPARLQLAVTDGEAGPLPCRLTAARAGGGERVVVDADGQAEVWLPAGAWTLWVSAGPERAMHREERTLSAGEEATVAVALPRVVDTAGWVAADLHAHAEQSPDSDAPMDLRLVAAAAEGLEALVGTEHDVVADWRPALGRAGLGDRLLVRTGVEVSTMHLGHFNVWPLVPDPARAGGGAPVWYGLDAEGLLDLLGAGAPGRVVQCNHPRFDRGGYAAFFDVAPPGPGGDATIARCDALEVLNGFDPDDVAQVVDEWLGLLGRGVRVTATGTSDAHAVADIAGRPRTLLWVGEGRDGPGAFTGDDLDAALRAGRAIATAGPLLTVELEDAEGARAAIGDALVPAAGPVVAHVRLEAPDWMPLGTLEVVAGGTVLLSEPVAEAPAVDGRRSVAREVAVEVPAGGTWVVAVHRGGPAAPPLLAYPSWAVTNPVRVGPPAP